MSATLITLISTFGGAIFVSIMGLIKVVYSTNKKISKENSKEHMEMKNKQQEIDKNGITYGKVVDLYNKTDNINSSLIELKVRQEKRDNIAGGNVFDLTEKIATTFQVQETKYKNLEERYNLICIENLKLELELEKTVEKNIALNKKNQFLENQFKRSRDKDLGISR